MDGSRFDARTITVALLCLAVLAFGAATLDSTKTPSKSLGAGSPGDPEDIGGDVGEKSEGNNGSSPFNFSRGTFAFGVCVPWLQKPLAKLAIVSIILFTFLLARYKEDSVAAFGVTLALTMPVFMIYLILGSCGRINLALSKAGKSGQGTAKDAGGGLIGGETSVVQPSLPQKLVLIALALTLVVVTVIVLTSDHDLSSTVDTEQSDEDDEDEEPEVPLADIGRAAGDAADRLEHEGDFENEIYRAWAEMTGFLTVDRPESSTPAEFASAAVEAGMDREDVEQLTGLFEEVRYGIAEPTAEREAEAVEILRRIESTYGGDEP